MGTNIYEREGIGTHWWLELLDSKVFPKSTQATIDRVMDEFNRDYTRFTDTSYVGRLNTHKSITDFPVELYDMLVVARDMYGVSDGVFDISVGGVLHGLGYGDRKHRGEVVPNFWNEVKLSRDKIVIPGESVIDLGD